MDDTKNKIILCATQRCGSTIVVEDLRNTGLLGTPAEYFIPWIKGKVKKEYGASLEDIFRMGATDNGIFSVKIMSNQLLDIDRRLNEAGPNGAAVEAQKVFPHFREAFRGATFVWLRRRDSLRQAISRVMAVQTGINHATREPQGKHFAGNILKGYSEDYNAEVRYNFKQLRHQLLRITQENLVWQRFFHDWDIEPITIDYETYVGTWQADIRRIADKVGVALPDDLVQRKLVKLSNKVNDDWFERFTNDLIGQ